MGKKIFYARGWCPRNYPIGFGHQPTNQEQRSCKSQSSEPTKAIEQGAGQTALDRQSNFTSLNVSYEKFFPVIRELIDLRWLEPLKTDPTKRDHNKKCAYHKEHDHTTEQCRSLQYLVEKLMRARYLRQYILLESKNGESSQNPITMAPATSAPLRVVIN